jgi:DNA repair exonuclease SbcCD ATPase subunit
VAVENYFNYFTEIEECFRRCRGTPTLLSPLDWALIESWKEAGRPLDAVLRGIERTFEKFKKRPQRFRMVNSLAYCSQEVDRAAEEIRTAEAEGGAPSKAAEPVPPPFPPEEILAYMSRNAEALELAARHWREHGKPDLANDLLAAAGEHRGIAGRHAIDAATDLNELENFLTALEEKLTALLTRASSVELLAEFRREVEGGLAAYRRKMSGAQIESLERQFLKKRLFEHYRVPRLSLFYL